MTGDVAGGALPIGSRFLTGDLGPHADAFMRLARLASATHDRFAFRTSSEADAFYGELAHRGGADFVPPAGRLLLVDEQPAAMFALVEPNLLKRRRLIGGVAIARAQRSTHDPALADRLRRAAGTLVSPSARDGYLSRLAVHPALARRGLGHALLTEAIAATRAFGLQRCVLEVAENNDLAIALYRGAGFSTIGEASTTDAESGARLGYLHMALAV